MVSHKKNKKDSNINKLKEKCKEYRNSYKEQNKVLKLKTIRECNICVEDKFKFKKFLCHHEICNDCVLKLRSFDCPYCRQNLKNSLSINQIKNIQNNIDKDVDEESRRLLEELENTMIPIEVEILDEDFVVYLSQKIDDIISNFQDSDIKNIMILFRNSQNIIRQTNTNFTYNILGIGQFNHLDDNLTIKKIMLILMLNSLLTL